MTMGQIKIVTDSTADLTPALTKEWNIQVIPLKVIFGDTAYREGIDLSNKEFYELLAESEKLPSTSQPSPVEFEKLYKELTEDGSSVISIHISGSMSGTYQSALIARNNLPGRDVTVIDSRVVSMALGHVVLAAARSVREGKTKEEVIARIHNVMQKVTTYFVVDTLENLQKGGRIGKAAALLGTVLNIKPVLTIDEGIIAPFEKIRGKGKALERIMEKAREQSMENKNMHCALVHGNALDEAVRFHQKLISGINCSEFVICEIGAVVGTHVGAGTIGFFFYADE